MREANKEMLQFGKRWMEIFGGLALSSYVLLPLFFPKRQHQADALFDLFFDLLIAFASMFMLTRIRPDLYTDQETRNMPLSLICAGCFYWLWNLYNLPWAALLSGFVFVWAYTCTRLIQYRFRLLRKPRIRSK